MSKRWLSCLVPLLMTTAASAQSRAPNVEKLVRDCRAGKAKECDKLLDVATGAVDPQLRLAAVAGLTDQKSLVRVASLPGPSAPRLAALERVTDPAKLFEVAEYHAFSGPDDVAVRLAAAARITDVTQLLALAKGSDNPTAIAVVGRLDPALLNGVYSAILEKRDALIWHRPVVEAVVAQIRDEALLEEIALTAADANVRRQAIDRMQDQARRAQIARTHKDRYFAVTVAKDLRDPTLLADLAMTGPDSGVRLGAISRVGDQAVLTRIARGDYAAARSGAGEYEVKQERLAAVEGLSDRTLLAALAKDAVVRASATARLNLLKASPPVEVSGVLVEARLGTRLGQERIELLEQNGRLVGETTTDAEGRFRFGPVIPSQWDLVGRSARASLAPPTPGAGPVEVSFRDDARVAEAFGHVCQAPRALDTTPAVPLLVLWEPFWQASLSYQRDHWHPDSRTFAWDRWKAVLCLAESRRLVGRYTDSAGRALGDAYAVQWSVKLVRLQDGRTFEKSFSADPRDSARSLGGPTGDRSGDPSAEVAAWLKTIE